MEELVTRKKDAALQWLQFVITRRHFLNDNIAFKTPILKIFMSKDLCFFSFFFASLFAYTKLPSFWKMGYTGKNPSLSRTSNPVKKRYYLEHYTRHNKITSIYNQIISPAKKIL